MKQHILVLEDEQSDYDPIAQALRGQAYDLVWTCTAHDALRHANEQAVDLLLLDLNLADMDSWRTLERFNARHPFLPVVMLSEWPVQVQRAASGLTDVCLEKPVNELHLRQTVQKLLAESHQSRRSRLMDSLQSWRRVPETCPGHDRGSYEKNNFARR
jgi:two-component system, OmpR family, copper resistance phosphate regulon response regulator CusR